MFRTTVLLSVTALALFGIACTETGDAAARGSNATAARGSDEFDASAATLTAERGRVAPGAYVVETLGTPFSLTVGEDWVVQVNGDATTVLTDPASGGPGDRDVVFMRPTDLSNPADLAAQLQEQEFWPVDDIEGWLDNLADGVVVSDIRETSLGGTPALAFDLELAEDFDCGQTYCALFFDIARRTGKPLDIGFDYRVWWVDQGQDVPIAVIVGAGRSARGFFDTAESLVSTVAFGPAVPHPFNDTGG